MCQFNHNTVFISFIVTSKQSPVLPSWQLPSPDPIITRGQPAKDPGPSGPRQKSLSPLRLFQSSTESPHPTGRQTVSTGIFGQLPSHGFHAPDRLLVASLPRVVSSVGKMMSSSLLLKGARPLPSQGSQLHPPVLQPGQCAPV